MNAVEFETKIAPGGELTIPRDIAGKIPAGEQVRVVLMWQATDADAEWRAAGRERFDSAYCPEDAVYEQLIDDTATR